MKKLLIMLFLLSAIYCLNVNKAQAQTYIDIQNAGDTAWFSNCSLPANISFFYYGTAGGYQQNDTILVEINFGDGTDTSFYRPIAPGTTTFYGSGIFHWYNLAGAYSVQFIVTGPDGSSDTLVDQSVMVASQCGDINGRLFLDANGDCIFNQGETPLQSWVAASYNGQIMSWALSNSSGDYHLTIPAGFTYTITAPLYNGLNVSCPASGQYIINSFPSNNKDFGMVCNPQWDLTGYIYGQGYRSNVPTLVWLNAYNQMLSCAPPTATVIIDLDPMLSYVSSTDIPISVSSNQIIFNAGQISGWSQGYSTGITLLPNIATNVGDTLCLTITVDPVAVDFNPIDNVKTICMEVRNSCDPNELYEKHAGVTSATVSPGTKLEYTIMFQNIGNDDAYDVSVVNELDANLDLSTLKITGASHDYNFYFNNNTMKFEFKNINLPAASVNEPMSHGFVSYTIEPKSTMPFGTSVFNTANIYFDFNAPIVTNTVEDIFNNTTGLATVEPNKNLVLYPNPADNYFMVATGTRVPALLTIYDVTGRTIIIQQEVVDQQKVNTENLTAGMYFVTMVADGITYTTKLSVK